MIKLNKFYWTCPYCNSNLDPGESCDCRKEVVEKPSNDSQKDSPTDANTSGVYPVVSGGE